jgi:hypothetical protein
MITDIQDRREGTNKVVPALHYLNYAIHHEDIRGGGGDIAPRFHKLGTRRKRSLRFIPNAHSTGSRVAPQWGVAGFLPTNFHSINCSTFIN